MSSFFARDSRVSADRLFHRIVKTTDFDTLPHVKAKSKVTDRLRPAAGKPHAPPKEKAPESASTTGRSTRSGRSAPKPRAFEDKPAKGKPLKKQHVVEKPTPAPKTAKATAGKRKKNETFSQ